MTLDGALGQFLVFVTVMLVAALLLSATEKPRR
jgi:hypothetical protein